MRSLVVTFLTSVALSAIALGAQAQQSGPIRLAPLPAPAPETPAGDPADSAPREASGGVLIRGLDAVAEDAVGVLSTADGSLGNEMWAGTGRETAIRLLDALPADYPLRDARALTRRLLLSIATPPAGASDSSSLLAARVAGLVAIGAPEDAIALARAASSREVPDHLAGSIVSAHFLRGDTAAGCEVLDRFGGGYADPFWQKALIICQIAGGKGAEASLGLDLLREERGDADPLFENIAYTAAVGSPVTADQLAMPGNADILTLALLNTAAVELPEWIIEADDPAILRAALASPRVDLSRKLARAHRALRDGRIGAEEVIAIYEAVEADDEAVAAALLDPDSVERDLWLAYLYLAARNQRVAIARSEALWEAWTLGEAAGLDDIVMATTAPLLRDIPATTDFGWLAAAATRAALLAGADDLAVEWYQLVVRQARSVSDMARATALLWPEMRVIGRNLPAAPVETPVAPPETRAAASIAAAAASTGLPTRAIAAPEPASQPAVIAVEARAPVPWSPTRLSRWIDLAENNPGTADVGTALYLLQVLGDPVSEAQWARAPVTDDGGTRDDTTDYAGDAGMMPSVAALAGLARASAAGRRAETALYAMIVLGQAGDVPHAGILGSVVRGLQRVGLDTDAQAIARAALVARAQ